MSAQMNVQPADEQNYLKRNALLNLILGFFFIGGTSYHYISDFILSSSLFMALSGLLALSTLIGMIVLLTKTISSSKKIQKKMFYYGSFNDEYLNYVNGKGYKYVFNFITFYFLVVWLGTGISESLLGALTIRQFCELTIGLVFISYAVPVLYLLKGADDE